MGEALNPAPIARSYSCSDGHLVAAPQPESSDSAGSQPQHPAAATGQQLEERQGRALMPHGGRSASAGANSRMDAAADGAVRDADAAGPGRGDAQDGAQPAARPAPPEAFVQVPQPAAVECVLQSCYPPLHASTSCSDSLMREFDCGFSFRLQLVHRSRLLCYCRWRRSRWWGCT